MGACYITLLVEDLNNKQYYGAFSNDDVGYFFGGIAQNEDFSLKEALSVSDGKGLISLFDTAYEGLFSEYGETALFEEYDTYPLKASLLKEYGITGKIGGQAEVEAMPVSKIKSVKVWESIEGDDYGSKAELELDFVNKTERVLTRSMYEEGMQIHEELRHLDTGDVEVLKDEFEEYENEDSDE